MRRLFLEPTAWLLLSIAIGLPSAHAADLVWEVENPFRFFKQGSSFAMHESAYAAARGDRAAALPADIVWRTERRLNDPDCRDPATPDTCGATQRTRYEQSRLGWAARSLGAVCYESEGRPRRYPAQCERRYSWGPAKEDYVLPEAHTIAIGLAPEHAAITGDCVWTWQPRSSGGRPETRRQACKDRLTIARVPYAVDASKSGVSVSVRLPDGRTFEDPAVVVQDVLMVALGDSFASGESNPDRPVSFSASREMVYDPLNTREEELAARPSDPSKFGLASAPDRFDPKSLPKRRLDDEEKGLIFRPTSPEFQSAFRQRGARWVSADCHRSQYGYPFRVGLQLALENRHRAVTGCSSTWMRATAGRKCADSSISSAISSAAAGPPRARVPRSTRCRCSRPAASRCRCSRSPSRGARPTGASGRSISSSCPSAATTSVSARWPPMP
jgi:hypothetical protein